MFFIQLFFVTMLIFPTALQLQRGIFLGILLTLSSFISIRCWTVHRDIFLIWLATLLVGILGITLGLINNAPGASRVLTVYIAWPIIYFIFIGLAHKLSVIRQLETALLVGISAATTLSLVVLVAGVAGIGELVFPLLSFLDAGFGNYDGFTEFRIYNLTTVMYGFPFTFAFLLSRRDELPGWHVIAIWLLLAALLTVAVGSGRRMFWLLVLLSPFVALFFLQLSVLRMRTVALIRAGIKMISLVVGFLGASIFLLNLDTASITHEFFNAFLGQEQSSGIRFQQASALWADFSQSPWFGKGLGASASGFIRSEEMPWAYELWHLALLMNVGLLGYLVYTIAVAWMVAKGMAVARIDRDFATLFVPLITGMIVFLLMTATNPYLAKFDYLWVIFLPAALLNAHLTSRSKND